MKTILEHACFSSENDHFEFDVVMSIITVTQMVDVSISGSFRNQKKGRGRKTEQWRTEYV